MVLAAVAGCVSETQPPESYTVRDSVGVRIVESTGPAWEPGESWSVGEEPALHIGVVQGAEEYQFTPKSRSRVNVVGYTNPIL